MKNARMTSCVRTLSSIVIPEKAAMSPVARIMHGILAERIRFRSRDSGVLSWLSFLKELSFTMPLIFFIFAMIWDLNFCMSTKMRMSGTIQKNFLGKFSWNCSALNLGFEALSSSSVCLGSLMIFLRVNGLLDLIQKICSRMLFTRRSLVLLYCSFERSSSMSMLTSSLLSFESAESSFCLSSRSARKAVFSLSPSVSPSAALSSNFVRMYSSGFEISSCFLEMV